MSREELLDNEMLYWLTNSGVCSAWLCWESLSWTPLLDKYFIPIHLPDPLHQWETWYRAVRTAMTRQAITEHDSDRTKHRLVHAHCTRRHPDNGPKARTTTADACPPTRAA